MNINGINGVLWRQNNSLIFVSMEEEYFIFSNFQLIKLNHDAKKIIAWDCLLIKPELVRTLKTEEYLKTLLLS